MRLIADGATPTSRLVLVKDLETDDGYAFELASPLFLDTGDRIDFEGEGLVVVRANGERLAPAGDWSTRCGPGSLCHQ
jgi:urease accessory protein UreE